VGIAVIIFILTFIICKFKTRPNLTTASHRKATVKETKNTNYNHEEESVGIFEDL
jgi:hypothetical protein